MSDSKACSTLMKIENKKFIRNLFIFKLKFLAMTKGKRILESRDRNPKVLEKGTKRNDRTCTFSLFTRRRITGGDTRSSISRNKDERGRGSRWVEAPTSVQAGLDRPRALSLHAYYPNAST